MQPGHECSLPDQLIDFTNSIEALPDNETRKKLVILINELINNDFSLLVQLLYHVDVFENKIKNALTGNTDKNSAEIIADLIIERQLQKVVNRKLFSKNNQQQSDEEKW